MSAIAARLATAGSTVNRRLMGRLVATGRIPRLGFQHYFIESEGLHSRVHLQNFYSTFWADLDVPATADIQIFAGDGRALGRIERRLAPFGGLFLEVREILAEVGASVTEGSVTIDLQPPRQVLADLAASSIPEPWSLRISTPFWMAYYDDEENYMYVHSIDRFAGAFRGVPRPVARVMSRRFSATGPSWRSGRVIDIEGLMDLQVVAINHSARARTAWLGIHDAVGDRPVWRTELSFAPHQLHRVRPDVEAIARELNALGGSQVRIGVDPLPTPNGKPYVLMRYGAGPLSLHHG